MTAILYLHRSHSNESGNRHAQSVTSSGQTLLVDRRLRLLRQAPGDRVHPDRHRQAHRKGERCDPAVAAWWVGVAEDDLWVSVLVLGEIRKGVELARRRDPQKAAVLEAWLTELVSDYSDRILPVDAAAAGEWGRIAAIRPVPAIDALLAATARANDLTLVTRNAADVAGLDVNVLNPFEPQ